MQAHTRLHVDADRSRAVVRTAKPLPKRTGRHNGCSYAMDPRIQDGILNVRGPAMRQGSTADPPTHIPLDC